MEEPLAAVHRAGELLATAYDAHPMSGRLLAQLPSFLRDLFAIARAGVEAGHDLKTVYDRAMAARGEGIGQRNALHLTMIGPPGWVCSNSANTLRYGNSIRRW